MKTIYERDESFERDLFQDSDFYREEYPTDAQEAIAKGFSTFEEPLTLLEEGVDLSDPSKIKDTGGPSFKDIKEWIFETRLDRKERKSGRKL